MTYVCIYLKSLCIFVLNVCETVYKAKNITSDLNVWELIQCHLRLVASFRISMSALMVVLVWIVLCLFVSFPDLFIGAHAKKQGEDLSDNDGDEDEGILFGDEDGSMSLNLFGIFFPVPFEWNLW